MTAVRLFLDQHPTHNINSQYTNLCTPIFHASELGYEGMVKLLLDRGAKQSYEDIKEETPLVAASRNGHEGVVKLLLDHDVRDRFAIEREEAAIIAASNNGHLRIVQLLLERGAGCDNRNALDETALLFVAEHGNVDVVQVLHDHSADCKTWHRSWDGDFESSVSVAMKLGHQHVVKRLLDEGAKLSYADDDTSDSELSSTSDSEGLEQPNDGSEGD